MAFRRSTIRNTCQTSRYDEPKRKFSALPATEQEILKFFNGKVKDQLGNERYEKISNGRMCNNSKCELMSTTSIFKLARARVKEINSKDTDISTILASLIDDQRNMPKDIFQDLELAVLIQAAAEKFAWKKFSCARKLLLLCYKSACKDCTPVQRSAFYFVEALEERMDHELGIIPTERLQKKPIDVIQTQISLETSMIASHQEFDISAISQFTGLQSILDNVALAKRIHLIDFRIKNGCQWTLLLQGLADREECPVEHLTITAVGTSKEMMEATGRRLSCSSATLDLSFSFQTVVSDLKDLRADMFKIEDDESVAIYSTICLFPLNACPGQLKTFIGVIKDLRPCVAVINELEVSVNSPSFVERFYGAFDYISAVFDFLRIVQGKGPHRRLIEGVYLWALIKNIVTTEGAERSHRHEKSRFWRASFERYGLVETELSSAALCQANLMIELAPGGKSCTIEMDGKCMLLGWKGAPVEFVSAWKCQLD